MDNSLEPQNQSPMVASSYDEYEVAPEIKSGYGMLPKFVQQTAENWRRTYGGKKHGAGEHADEATSRMANKLRETYGADRLTDATDTEIVDTYRQFKYGTIDPEQAHAQMLNELLPGYTPKVTGVTGGLAKGVGQLAGDLIGAPLIGAFTLQALPVTISNLQRAATKLNQMVSAGVDPQSAGYRAAQEEYFQHLNALHGQTEALPAAGALTAATVAAALTSGVALGAEGAAAGVAGGMAKFLPEAAGPAAQFAIKWGVRPAAKMATEFGIWEGSKYAALGQFDKVPEKAWEGIKQGAMSGPFFHAGFAGLGAVAAPVIRTAMDIWPNAAHQALKDNGERIFDQFARDTKGAIDDFNIDLQGDIRSQVNTIITRLWDQSVAGTNSARTLADDLTAHLEGFRDRNPDFKPDWQIKAEAKPTPETGPETPAGVSASTPDEQLKDEFIGPDGKTYRVKDVRQLGFLIKRYKLVSETENPELKEALIREILKRNEGQLPKGLELPTWRRPPTPEGAPPVPAADPHELPPDWGSSPSDVHFNPDAPITPTTAAAAPAGRGSAWAQNPRWQSRGAIDGDLYPPRTPTLGDALLDMARRLAQRIEDFRGILANSGRKHPGWGQLLTDSGEGALERIRKQVQILNDQYGEGTAELIYDSGTTVSMRLNREFVAWKEGGEKGMYIPHYLSSSDNTAINEEGALSALRQMLRRMGWGEDRTAVMDPSGRIYMTDIEEYARTLLETAREQGPQMSPQMRAARRDEWLRTRDEVQARAQAADAARAQGPYDVRTPSDSRIPAALRNNRVNPNAPVAPWEWNKPKAAPPEPAPPSGPPATPAGPQVPVPEARLYDSIGTAVKDKKGKVIPGVRVHGDKQLNVRMNEANDALVIGKVGTNIPEAQMKDILIKADEHGATVERLINDSPDNKKKIEVLEKLGFKRAGTKDGAVIMRRSPAPPGTLTSGQAASVFPTSPDAAARATGATPDNGLVAGGNIVPGQPVVRPPEPDAPPLMLNGQAVLRIGESPTSAMDPPMSTTQPTPRVKIVMTRGYPYKSGMEQHLEKLRELLANEKDPAKIKELEGYIRNTELAYAQSEYQTLPEGAQLEPRIVNGQHYVDPASGRPVYNVTLPDGDVVQVILENTPPTQPVPAAAPPPSAPAPRDMGGKQIAIRLHTPAGAKKSDVLKLFGEKAKGLNFLLRKDGDGWVVVFDPKKVRAHMQGVGALLEMGIPEEAMHAGGWWNPKDKKWELQDMYNENAPATPAAAPVQTAPGQNALLGPQHFEFALNQVKEAYDKLPPIDEISSDNFAEAVSPLTTAVQRVYSVAKDAKMLPTLMADHDFKNRISLVISAHEMAGKPLPPDIVELNNKLVQYHKEQWALRNKK